MKPNLPHENEASSPPVAKRDSGEESREDLDFEVQDELVDGLIDKIRAKIEQSAVILNSTKSEDDTSTCSNAAAPIASPPTVFAASKTAAIATADEEKQAKLLNQIQSTLSAK
jgi:hypothetical protein